MAETGHTAGEYISHHLQNLTVCKKDGEWVWNECHGNFWALNVDSMFFAVLLGALLVWFFSRSVSSEKLIELPASGLVVMGVSVFISVDKSWLQRNLYMRLTS